MGSEMCIRDSQIILHILPVDPVGSPLRPDFAVPHPLELGMEYGKIPAGGQELVQNLDVVVTWDLVPPFLPLHGAEDFGGFDLQDAGAAGG